MSSALLLRARDVPPDLARFFAPVTTDKTVWTVKSEPSNYDFCDGCGSLFIGSDRKGIREFCKACGAEWPKSKRREKACPACGDEDAGRERECPTCQRRDKWVAHYAAFPSGLPRRCILAGTSAAGCCPECGKPWERVVVAGDSDREHQRACGSDGEGGYHGDGKPEPPIGQAPGDVKRNVLAGMRDRGTVGWLPACDCPVQPPAPVSLAQARMCTLPCRVLDPFSGTGTTPLVAAQLGRDWLAIEGSPSYARMSRERIRVLGTRKAKAMPAEAMPLFANGGKADA